MMPQNREGLQDTFKKNEILTEAAKTVTTIKRG